MLQLVKVITLQCNYNIDKTRFKRAGQFDR